MDFGKTFFSHLSGASNVLFTGEHATDRIPPELNDLGLNANDLRNCKDVYDPGSLELMRALASRFNASYLYQDLSRLVIDVNRRFDAPTKHTNGYHTRLVKTQILTIRDGQEVIVPIPHNQDIAEEVERTLYETLCVPYQDQLLQIVNELKKQHTHVFVIPIHSFFPIYAGEERIVDIDLMGYIKPEAAAVMCNAIQTSHPRYRTAIDEPWSAASVDGGVMFTLNGITDITALAIDVKNDNLSDVARIEGVADALASGIAALRSAQ